MKIFRPSEGLTLIETLVVVFLIAIFVRLFLPPLGGALPYEIRNGSRELAGKFQHASQRAIATGETHRWVIDLDEQRSRLEWLEVSEPEVEEGLPSHAGLLDVTAPRSSEQFVPVPSRLGEWQQLSQETLRIESVWIGEEEFDSDTVWIFFGPDGGADPAELLLLDADGRAMSLSIQAFTSEVVTTDVSP